MLMFAPIAIRFIPESKRYWMPVVELIVSKSVLVGELLAKVSIMLSDRSLLKTLVYTRVFLWTNAKVMAVL